MRTQLNAKMRKALLLALRRMTRPMANKWHFAFMVYYRSDLGLYKFKDIYVLPTVFYRFMTWLCNLIASVNTVDHNTLHCRWLQRVVNWMIHRIPDKIRFA